MQKICEEAKPYVMWGIRGFCDFARQHPMNYGKYKGTEWWQIPVVLLDLYRTSQKVKDQLTGSHLRDAVVDIDGYKAPAIEVIYNGVNTFIFKAKDVPAMMGHRINLLKPKDLEDFGV